MTPADVPSACELLNSYLSKFKLAPVMDNADFAHWLLPRHNVVDSFVVVNEEGRVTDMCRYEIERGENSNIDFFTSFLTFIIPSLFYFTSLSFYHLHSTVIGNTTYPTLNAVYSFYNVATSMPLKVRHKYMLFTCPPVRPGLSLNSFGKMFALSLFASTLFNTQGAITF